MYGRTMSIALGDRETDSTEIFESMNAIPTFLVVVSPGVASDEITRHARGARAAGIDIGAGANIRDLGRVQSQQLAGVEKATRVRLECIDRRIRCARHDRKNV